MPAPTIAIVGVAMTLLILLNPDAVFADLL
jgi:hypothetical protein